MPMYEYKCLKCGHTFDKIQSFDSPNPACQKLLEDQKHFCDGETERLISRSNFALKGGGWYSDGYGK